MSEVIKAAIKAAIVVTETPSGDSSRDMQYLAALRKRILTVFKNNYDYKPRPDVKVSCTLTGSWGWNSDSKNKQGYWIANLGKITLDCYTNQRYGKTVPWRKMENYGYWSLNLLFKDGTRGYILDGIELLGGPKSASVIQKGIADKLTNGNDLGEYIFKEMLKVCGVEDPDKEFRTEPRR